MPPRGGEPTSANAFRRDPAQMCYRFSVTDRERRIVSHYAVQDSPGYGDTFDMRDRISDMLEFIEGTGAAYAGLERAHRQDDDGAKATDPRIDVCLYFIPPHRLKEVDLAFMRELSNVVSLIPVGGMGDRWDLLVHPRN